MKHKITITNNEKGEVSASASVDGYQVGLRGTGDQVDFLVSSVMNTITFIERFGLDRWKEVDSTMGNPGRIVTEEERNISHNKPDINHFEIVEEMSSSTDE